MSLEEVWGVTASSLDRARTCIEHSAWEDALAALADADLGPGSESEALELRALAEYGRGRFEAAVTAWEDLHALSIGAGDRRGAARAAAMVATYLMMDTGLMAAVRGWLRRAERLVDGDSGASARALIAMTRAYERFVCGDLASARTAAASAVELGEELGVDAAVVIGRVAAARVTILDGDVQAGLDELDDIATLLMSGSVDALTTGMMYCELICAAQGLAMYGRASEWTELMERWRPGRAPGGINGRCRVHRAELLRMSGPCEAAEAEALAACAALRPWMRREFGWPLTELGTIRLRKGDLDGAEEAFRAAHDHAWSPQPGWALLHLERGDIATAVALIDDAVERPADVPWKERPPHGELRLAPLLDAQAEIAAAVGDAEGVARAARRLREIADTYGSGELEAMAHCAEARAALASGATEEVVVHGTASVTRWAALAAPYELGTARLLLGAAHRSAGNPAAARMEWTAARTAFLDFGARRRADEAQDLLDRLGARPEEGAPPVRASASFVRYGDLRCISFDGLPTEMTDLKGFRYVERLVCAPDREFLALDLVAAEHGGGQRAPGPSPVPGADDGLQMTEGADAPLPLIDDQARDAYRRRLAEIEEEIEDAERHHDLGRQELAQHDREFLIAELERAVGLVGRRRTVPGSAERARTSVTRAIRYAIRRLGQRQPALAAHLDRCVVTGTYCSYRPDPLVEVSWTTSTRPQEAIPP